MISPFRWLWGLLPLLVLGFALTIFKLPSIERELERSISQVDAPQWAQLSIAGRDVVLAGYAPTVKAKDQLLRRIGGVPGIRRIESRMSVKVPASPFVTVFRKTPGMLLVSGSIDEEADRQRVETGFATSDLAIDTNLMVRSGAPRRWRQAVGHAISALMRIDVGSVYVIDDLVFIDATTSASAMPGLSAHLEKSAPAGVRVVVNLTANTRQDPIWSVVIDKDSVVLSGEVADPASRESLFKRARDAFDDRTVIDRTMPNRRVPRHWHLVARALLQQSSRLLSGSLRLEGRQATISGRVLTPVTSHDIAASLSRSMPEGYVLNTSIDVATPGTPITNSACQQNIDEVLTRRQIKFAPGGSEISSGSLRTLDRIFNALFRCSSAAIEIRGHSDASGPEPELMVLSLRRARAVLRYLSGAGIDQERMVAVGLGSSEPVATNRTMQGRSRNRRIELKIATGE